MTKSFVKNVFDLSGLKTIEIAQMIGVNASSVRKWVNGDMKPTANHQEIIRAKFKKEIAKLYK